MRFNWNENSETPTQIQIFYFSLWSIITTMTIIKQEDDKEKQEYNKF